MVGKRRVLAILILLIGAMAGSFLRAPAEARPSEHFSGTHFGAHNLPPGCIADMSADNPDNKCFHMRTDMNALDSPQVDVLVLVPVSPTAERDMRIMRQSVEMWEAGIHYMAAEMGLGWLASGMQFHVTVDYVDLTGGQGGEFTTYPIVDPEIVIVATNPVGGAGIGIDPVATAGESGAAPVVLTDENGVPCHGIQNPFDLQAWENLPGFDDHHHNRTGTYVEDCGGAGGNTCFAINGAIDPAPDKLDVFNMFDLVSHEFGHCLTIGHVGDGAEGAWGVVPTNDIMSYNSDPPGGTKCVSSLDVEGIALRMSKYLDVNGDGVVNDQDHLAANDPVGDGTSPFQVQNPRDHTYASSTGSPLDCPQPDVGLLPGAPRTQWTPTPVNTTEPVLDVTSPTDGATASDGHVNVTGTVEHRALNPEPVPTSATGSYDDPDNDASTAMTEITSLDVAATATDVDATIHLKDLWPSTDAASPTSYSLIIDGRKFDSFVRYPIDNNPMTFDNGAGGYVAAADGGSSWDLNAKTVSFHISRALLAKAQIVSPYFVRSTANLGSLATTSPDDSAPETRHNVGVASASVARPVGSRAAVGSSFETVSFQHDGGNTYYPEDSTLGVPQFVYDSGTRHNFNMDVAQTSDVAFSLTWTDTAGGTDLDLSVTGAANSGSQGATQGSSESFVLRDVKGPLHLEVDPYMVTDPTGSTYTLTATVTPTAAPPDSDGDGVPDASDACPTVAANTANGCPTVATEHVHVYVDDVLTASQDVNTIDGPSAFDIPVDLTAGQHVLRVDWESKGTVLASRSVNVSGPAPVPTGSASISGTPPAGGSASTARTPAPPTAATPIKRVL